MSVGTDVYQAVTDRFIHALEEGVVPWHKPWIASGDCNPKTGTVYRGINTLLLALYKLAAQERGAEYGNLWSTYNGWRKLGGHVREGETAQGQFVVYWDRIAKVKQDEVTGEDKLTQFFLLKTYTIFNIAQTEDVQIPEKYLPKPEVERVDWEELAQSFISGMANPPKEMVDDHAYYMPLTDTVAVPSRKDFDSPAHYWATRFHEYVHSTGHKDRLNREDAFGNGFGTEKYSKEELIAEMGAAFLMEKVGVLDDTFENNAAYLAGWLKRIKEEPKLIVQAAGRAEKAAEYIAPSEVEAEEAKAA